MDLFGSGWTWLVKDSWGRLHIRALPNAENPLLAGEVPLLTCDLWEHAYYLDWKSERKKYLENFWTLIDWTFIESNLDQPLLHLSSRERNSREIHFLQAVQ